MDGLDEFQGKPEKILSLLHGILSLPSVKLCVASRPWTEFKDAFHHQPPDGNIFQLSSYRQYTIQYLHRTVKDYIESASTQDLFGPVLKSAA